MKSYQRDHSGTSSSTGNNIKMVGQIELQWNVMQSITSITMKKHNKHKTTDQAAQNVILLI